ncbi:toprim domain-containing protein, partial [Oleiphilus sp. HI0043]|uniref:toprim domain-containing protein n=11 Tax=Oleiphilus TaxID=141450 RepID=UPI000AB83237
EANQATRHLDKLLVVEGYMDVVALAQYGINYAVATLGTATNSENLSHLLRRCKHIIFCFDGDRAGLQAARKAMENALPIFEDGMQLDFLLLPEGED